jgi:hypothetical protein
VLPALCRPTRLPAVNIAIYQTADMIWLHVRNSAAQMRKARGWEGLGWIAKAEAHDTKVAGRRVKVKVTWLRITEAVRKAIAE